MNTLDNPYHTTFDLAEFLLLPENDPLDVGVGYWTIRQHIAMFDWDSLHDEDYKRNLLRDFIAAGLAPHLKAIRRHSLNHVMFPVRLSYRIVAWTTIQTASSIIEHDARGQCWS